MFQRTDQKPEFIDIPVIPALVDIDDVVASNGRLIPQESVAVVKMLITNMNAGDGRYSKKDLGTAYNITKIQGQYFAIYKGEKHDKLMGKGSFGSVKLAQDIDTGTWVVMKSIHKKADHSPEVHAKSIAVETENLKKAGQFIGHLQRSSSKNIDVDDVQTKDIILMVLAPGTTVAHIIKHRNMAAVKWLDLAIGIMQETTDLHAKGLLHRDIKPENMLAQPLTNTVVLIDLGIARQYNPDTKAYQGGRAGTDKYMAPEILPQKKKQYIYNEATEVYALGITLIKLFKLERNGNKVSKTLPAVQQIHNQRLLDNLCQLTQAMTAKKPKDRPALKDVIDILEDLRNNELDLVSKLHSIAYVNVTHFHLLDDAQKEKLFTALKDADEVQLCLAPNPWAQELLMIIRHEFELHGVNVSSQGIIVKGNDNEKTLQHLKQITADRSDTSDMICRGFYLDLSRDIDPNYEYQLKRSINSLEFSQQQSVMVDANIKAQIERISEKNPSDRRLQYLREFQHDLNTREIRTYQQLFARMRLLQEDMIKHESSSPTKNLLRKLGFTSTVEKEVERTFSSVYTDVHRQPHGKKNT